MTKTQIINNSNAGSKKLFQRDSTSPIMQDSTAFYQLDDVGGANGQVVDNLMPTSVCKDNLNSYIMELKKATHNKSRRNAESKSKGRK